MKKTDDVKKKDTAAKDSLKDKDNKKPQKEKKEKKDKATKKAEKKEKKAAKKAQRKADRKNPEIQSAKKVLAIKCIAAILSAAIAFIFIGNIFNSVTEIVRMDEAQKYKDEAKLAEAQAAAGNANNANGNSSQNGGNGGGSQAPSTPAPEPGEKDESGAPVKPADGIQTLEYFNAAINKVKTGASSVDQKKVENYLAGSPTIPGALNGVYKMLGGDGWLDKMLKDNSQGAATYKGADIKAKFPVEGESYASVLQPADVKAATCTESNGIYTITITTLPDGMGTNHKHGAGRNPKALNVILPSTVNSNIPGAAKSLVGEAKMAYPSSTITITVDAATGNVLTANYDLKWTISFTKMAATLPLGTRANYEIKW